MRLPLEYSSNVYKIKFLTGEDIPDALALCQENTAYFKRKRLPEFPGTLLLAQTMMNRILSQRLQGQAAQ